MMGVFSSMLCSGMLLHPRSAHRCAYSASCCAAAAAAACCNLALVLLRADHQLDYRCDTATTPAPRPDNVRFEQPDVQELVAVVLSALNAQLAAITPPFAVTMEARYGAGAPDPSPAVGSPFTCSASRLVGVLVRCL